MKRAYFICLFQCLTTTFSLAQSNPVPLTNQNARVVSPISASEADPKAQAKILESYGKLPLSFEANHGQADGRVKFLSRTGGYTLFLTGDEAVLAIRGKKAKKSSPQSLKPAAAAGMQAGFVSGHRFSDAASPSQEAAPLGAGPAEAATESTTAGVLRMKLRNANSAARVTGLDELAGTSNYFIGNDPAKWRSNVPTYAKVKYEGIYSGIDLVYYGNQRQLEYDFIVAPGADPRRIEFDVRGAERIRRDEHGDLVLKMKMGEGEIRWHKPVVYQEKNGTRQLVVARYAITDANRVGFEVAKYDASRPLYIDPLIYSTYLGGSAYDAGYGIAVDSAGNAYVTGETLSTDFPTMNPLQANYAGGCCGNGDAFVSKLNPSGSALVYSTYLGGSGGDQGAGIGVDSAGYAYVTGSTSSSNFPTNNPLQSANGGSTTAFVTKINTAGSALVYSTYLGGSGGDIGSSIAVDSAGNAYVTGQTASTDFPTEDPLQSANGGGGDAFVAKINPSGSALVYSTYLGGSGVDDGLGIAADSAGHAYVTGYTESTDFPTMNPLQPTPGNAFVTKINPAGTALVYSTYLLGALGGVSRGGTGIVADSMGNAYVTGTTFTRICGPVSCLFFPFVEKLNPTGSAFVYVYAGWVDSIDDGRGNGIAVDSSGSAYVIGTAGQLRHDNSDLRAFVAKLNPSGSLVGRPPYLRSRTSFEGVWGYGIAADGSGNAYITGLTNAEDFPTKHPLQAALAGGYGGHDAFVTKIDMRAVTRTGLSSSPNPSNYGQAVTFTAVITSGLGAPPNGETVTFERGATVLGTVALSGGSASFTTSTLPVGTDYIKAVYGGDSNFGDRTSKAVKQVVNKISTTTTLASSQNPSNVGQTVTFTASVTPQFGTVKGTVTFYDGATGLTTVFLSGGVAKFTTSTLASGKHSITATYNGSNNFDGSSASLTQTVN